MSNKISKANLTRWQADPVAFVEEVLHDPETGKPFRLYEAQKVFLRHAVTLTPEGRLLYPEQLWAAPKKSGKTAFAAMIKIYFVYILGGRFAEGYCCANDFEQSAGRVFQAACRIIEASPLLKNEAHITGSQIEFPRTGATITALANDYAGAAGANPTITVFDELWAYTSEKAVRLWDEMVPPPTRKIACRLTVTYAGFEGQSVLLEGLHKKGLSGEQLAPDLYAAGGFLCYWTNELRAPWQTDFWLEQMKAQLRPNAFLRMIKNIWVSTESDFIPMEWWDAATTERPIVADPNLPVVVGVDAGLKRDSAAVVACCWDAGKVRIVNHKIFYPRKDDPLDIEDTLETAIRDFRSRFHLREVLYDPWQFARSAQGLSKEGIKMREFPQTTPNLTAMSTNLYELLKGGNLIAYPDEAIRLAVSQAVAKESSRGVKITKEKCSHKIDVVVALAMAALAATGSAVKPMSREEFKKGVFTDNNPYSFTAQLRAGRSWEQTDDWHEDSLNYVPNRTGKKDYTDW